MQKQCSRIAIAMQMHMQMHKLKYKLKYKTYAKHRNNTKQSYLLGKG